MKKNIWNIKIPTLLGLILITVGIGITSFLVQRGVILTGFAGPSNKPQNIRMSNITDSSFTVSYTTQDSVLGSVNYGKTEVLGQTAIDERDKNNQSVSPKKLHSIKITSLEPQSTYFFNVSSGQDTYLNNESLFRVTTGPVLKRQKDKNTISGKILLPDGTAPSEAIIYMSAEGSQLVSILADKNGSYSIPTSSIRSSDLGSYIKDSNLQASKLLILGHGLVSNVALSPKEPSMPTIILSKNYDFTVDKEPIPQVATPSAQVAGFPSFTAEEITSPTEPKILTPQKDQELIDNRPSFQGTALPNEEVEIVINSDEEIKQTILSDANGRWRFRPETPLSPGDHTITIKTKDKSGIIKAITQTFTVYAAGTQVSQSATPSATAAPTPIPSSSPTPTPSPVPAGAASPILTPSPAATPTPTPTIAPIIEAVPISTYSAVPAAPGSYTLFAGTILGLSAVGLGIFLLLLSRGRFASL